MTEETKIIKHIKNDLYEYGLIERTYENGKVIPEVTINKIDTKALSINSHVVPSIAFSGDSRHILDVNNYTIRVSGHSSQTIEEIKELMAYQQKALDFIEEIRAIHEEYLKERGL